MKTFLFLVTALAMLVSSARSATIVLSGRIEGRLPGSILGDVNYHTLDFYWFRVPEATTVTFSHCTTYGLGGSWGTQLDLHVYPNADAHADLTPIAAIAGAGGFCEGRTFNLLAGNYIIDFKPGDTGYDGADGLVPFSGSGRDFFWFDYQTTITGNLELYESWIGQTDRTFLITSIPESGTGLLLVSALAALLPRRRRMTSLFSKTPAVVLLLLLVACVAPVSAQQGVLEWPSREGMGYRLQRSGTLGGTQTPWINLPFE